MTMEIVVCIKQVPDTAKIEVDETTGTLKREGAEVKMNPFDLSAIETALQIREATGGTVWVISMGPTQAAQVLREAFMMGADRGVLLCDPRFAGSDTLATSYTLALGIRTAVKNPQLIICGKQTTDGDTGQVGPEIAEFLQIPHVCNVSRLVEAREHALALMVDLQEMLQKVQVECPCLITVEKDIFPPRLPSFRKREEARHKLIDVLGCSDLETGDPGCFGLQGSPTHVEKMFPPVVDKPQEIWTGTGIDLAERLVDRLQRMKLWLPRDH